MAGETWSKKLVEAHKAGKTIVVTFGTCKKVEYKPRNKFDPSPWTDGFFRYTGRECHIDEED